MSKKGVTSSSSGSEGSHASPANEWQSHRCTKACLCKVVGCCVDLSKLGKPYCLKRRVCPEHLKAAAVQCKGAGEQLWRFCQQCGRMEHLQRFTGANRSCTEGLAKRRNRNTNKQQQQQPSQQAAAALCSCVQLAQLAQAGDIQHPMLQQPQQEAGQAFTWQLPADVASTDPAAHYAMGASTECYNPNRSYSADLSGLVDCSIETASCGDASDGFEGLTDADLEAMIEQELHAAAAELAADAAATGGYNAGIDQQVTAAVLPTGEAGAVTALPVAAAAVSASAMQAAAAAAAAHHARLQMLMAEYAELSAALQELQQLQQANGTMYEAGSGNATMSCF